MYTKNTISRRRPSGWVERRRYFRRLFDQVRVKTLKEEETPKVAGAPAPETD